MNRYDLAQQLRDCELRLQRTPLAYVHVVTDEEIVEAFLTCGFCQQKLYQTTQLEEKTIAEVTSLEEFLERINSAFHWHKKVKHEN